MLQKRQFPLEYILYIDIEEKFKGIILSIWGLTSLYQSPYIQPFGMYQSPYFSSFMPMPSIFNFGGSIYNTFTNNIFNYLQPFGGGLPSHNMFMANIPYTQPMNYYSGFMNFAPITPPTSAKSDFGYLTLNGHMPDKSTEIDTKSKTEIKTVKKSSPPVKKTTAAPQKSKTQKKTEVATQNTTVPISKNTTSASPTQNTEHVAPKCTAKALPALETVNYNEDKAEKLTRAIASISRENGFRNRCAASVKRAIEAAGLGKYQSGHGYQLADILSRNTNFREIFASGLDLSKLPAGCILVYDRGVAGYSSRYGHTEITLGNGSAASDGITHNIKQGARVFVPV